MLGIGNSNTPNRDISKAQHRRAKPGMRVVGILFLVAAVLITVSTIFIYEVDLLRIHAREKMTNQLLVLQHLDDFLSSMKDTETGQRGYLLTGDEQYLEPYVNARAQLRTKLDDLQRLTLTGQLSRETVAHVVALTQQKLDELERTIQLRRERGLDAALAIVRQNQGKQLMDEIRTEIGQLRTEETKDYAVASENANRAADLRTLTIVVACLLNLAFVGWAFRKVYGEVRELSLLPAQNPAPVLRIARNGILLHANPAAFNMLCDWNLVVGQAAPQQLFSAAAAALSTEKVLAQEVSTGGSTFLISIVPIVDSGYANLYGIDLTERKRAEEALRFSEQRAKAFLSNSAVIAWLKDEEGRNIFLSDNYTRRFELKEWKNKTDFELWPRDVAETFRKNDLAMLERNEPFECIEEARTPDGKVSFWLNSKFWFQDESGRKYIGGVGVDITERKRAEEALRDTNEALKKREALLAEAVRTAEDATRAKDEFLAIVSHELRTPLGAMLGWVRLLQSGTMDAARTTRGLSVIERNINVQTQLIEDLLDISRIVAGKMNLNIRPTNLEKVVVAAIECVRPAADARNIKIKADLKPIWLPGDSDRLQQVVWNLLSNAIKFSENHGQVSVQLEESTTQTRIVVSDKGKGIAPEFLPLLFNRFSQEDSSSTRRHGGLGLGLSIVKHLVEAHGGSVAVESEGVGRGATFTIILPAPVFQNAHIKTDATQSDNQRRADLTGLRVMAIDDEGDARDLLDTIISTRGGIVACASSAVDALSAIETFKPHVVVSDIGMPGMDGYEFIQKVRHMADECLSNIPAIALTAFARDEDRHRALEAGFTAYESKPIEPDRLVSLIARLAGQKSEAKSNVI